MSAKLTNDDRCAVDLLLDHTGITTQAGPINACFTTAPAELHQRLRKVEELLHNLDACPVSEPPSDLLARTLTRCKLGDLPATAADLAEPIGVRQQA